MATLGQTEYRDFCGLLGLQPREDLTPAARAKELPAWICRELVATEAARDRLRGWVEAGSHSPTADDVVRRTRFLGDFGIRQVVLETLHKRVAPPAAYFLLERAFFVGIGFSAEGMTAMCSAPPGPSMAAVLICGASRDPRQIRNVVLHELAHAWLLPDGSDPVEAVSSISAATILGAASDPEWMARLRRNLELSERQADALARAWGADIEDSDVHNVESLRRRARVLAETYA
jgi:hypothetical protein